MMQAKLASSAFKNMLRAARFRTIGDFQHTVRPLLTRRGPQHAGQRRIAVLDQAPIVAGRLAYYADPKFKGMFDA